MASFLRSKTAVWIAKHLVPAGIAAISLLLILGYVFVFRGQIAAIRNADRVARLGDELRAKQSYLQKLDALEEQYKAFDADDVARVRQMMPKEDDVPGLLSMLEATARLSDIQLVSINFSSGDTSGIKGVDGVGAMGIALSLEHANYQRFKLFLQALESNLRLFDVRNASINPTGASYTLTMRAYMWTKKAL